MIAERDLNSVLVVAKKVDDAISEGLAALEATLDEVKVEVVESGGLFRKAKVKLTLEKEEQAADVKSEAKPEKTAAAEKSDKAEKPARQKSEAAVKAEKPTKPEPSEKQAKTGGKSSPKPIAPAKTEGAPAAEQEKPHKPAREEAAAALDKAYDFVKELVAKMGFTAQVDRDPSDPELINIDAPAGDDSLLIGRHGETLSALSYLAETGARADKTRVSVTVDCNGYRGRRAASLTAMAHRRADEAVNKGRRIKLEPMERIDRRTIHNALTGDERVSTASEGKEPYRFVVIAPKDEHKGGGRRHHHRRDKFERGEKQADAPVEAESVEDTQE